MITAIGKIMAFLGLVILCGCSGVSSKWVGTWEGNMNLPSGQGLSPSDAVSLGHVSLTIKPDGTFTLFSVLEKTGSVRFQDEKAYLRVEEIMGRPVKEQGDAADKMNVEVVLTLVDEKTLSYVDPVEPRRMPDGSAPPPLKLVRKDKE